MEYTTAMGMLIRELPSVAAAYGAYRDLPNEVLQECIRLIMEKFGKLGMEEIREAYRQHSAGEIEQNGKSLEMYAGVFNAGHLGKVLTAYTKNRDRIVTQYIKIEAEETLKENNILNAQNKKEWFNKHFLTLATQQAQNIKSWKDTPLFWYQAMRSRQIFELEKDEALAIFEQAKNILKAKKASKSEDKNSIIFRNSFEKEWTPQTIARKLSVWLKFVLPLKVEELKKNELLIESLKEQFMEVTEKVEFESWLDNKLKAII